MDIRPLDDRLSVRSIFNPHNNCVALLTDPSPIFSPRRIDGFDAPFLIPKMSTAQSWHHHLAVFIIDGLSCRHITALAEDAAGSFGECDPAWLDILPTALTDTTASSIGERSSMVADAV